MNSGIAACYLANDHADARNPRSVAGVVLLTVACRDDVRNPE